MRDSPRGRAVGRAAWLSFSSKQEPALPLNRAGARASTEMFAVVAGVGELDSGDYGRLVEDAGDRGVALRAGAGAPAGRAASRGNAGVHGAGEVADGRPRGDRRRAGHRADGAAVSSGGGGRGGGILARRRGAVRLG